MSEAPLRHTPEPMPRVGVDMPLGDDLDWKKEWFSLAAQRNKDVSVLLNALASETPYRWIPVSEGLPADQPGGWLVFDTDAGKLWFETNLPSWWNRKDERGREFDGPTVTHWREDFYPLPGPRK